MINKMTDIKHTEDRDHKSNADKIKSAAHAMVSNASTRYKVTTHDLPLCCPMPQMTLWNSHPRIYLAIEKTGEARCPYCGALYQCRDTNVG